MKYTFLIKCSLICLLTPPTWLVLGTETAAALPGSANLSNVTPVPPAQVEDKEIPPQTMVSHRTAAFGTFVQCRRDAANNTDAN